MGISTQQLFNKKELKWADRLFLQWWWVALFFVLVLFCFEQGERRQQRLWQQFSASLKELKQQKMVELERREELQLQINSQSDPDWIELTLMQGLGLVPEGYQKVLFVSKETPWTP